MMNGELEWIWKDEAVAYRGICLEGLRETTKLSQDRRCVSRDSN
jgi:hypothetical protein